MLPAIPELFRAAPIAERLIGQWPGRAAGDGPLGPALTRLAAWRSRPPFGDDEWWQARLAADGLSQASLLALLTESVPELAGRLQTLPWATALAEMVLSGTVLSGAGLSGAGPSGAGLRGVAGTAAPDRRPAEGDGGAHFAHVAGPLLADARSRLLRRLRALGSETGQDMFDPESLAGQLYAPLPGILDRMLMRSVVLELNIARVSGELRGQDPAERFAWFTGALGDASRRRALFTAYPVLGRQLVIAAHSWLRASSRFAEHLAADWAGIRAAFAPGRALGPVGEITAGLGDRHRRGATVMRVRWHDGLELMYKPRPSTIDEHFQQLVSWVNGHGAVLPLRTVRCLGGPDHGWMEFVAAGPCPDEAARHRFYHRQGALLALLYLLNATDFHAENLIAAGEHPVLVDLETLVQPGIGADTSAMTGAEAAATAAVRGSVLMAGLLPAQSWVGQAGEPVDVSGLGFRLGQRFPLAVPMLRDAGSDTVRVELGEVTMSAPAHRPVDAQTPLQLLDYADDLLAGFTGVYELCAARRGELLAGPLAAFSRDEVRVVLRSTLWYSTLLQTGFHPDVLRDALDRERHFDALWRDVPRQPGLAGCVGPERRDLWRNDIPVFTAWADRPALYDSDHQVVRDFPVVPGIQQVTRRLAGLDDDDLARQRSLIKGALATTVADAVGLPGPPSYVRASVSAPASREDLVAAADAVGWRLAKLAFRADGSAQWIGAHLLNGQTWSLGLLRPDLYDGLAGIALFLGWLGELTGDPQHTRLAGEALRTVRRQLDRDGLTRLGGMSGVAGLVYGLGELGRLWCDESLWELAETQARALAGRTDEDVHYDFVAGSAGDIAALVTLNAARPADWLQRRIAASADHLLAAALSTPEGIGWIPRALDGGRPISGFAHGAAGIAAPLLAAWEILGDERYRQAAHDAVTFEQATFNRHHGRWRELSERAARGWPDGEPRSGFWCYGSMGIGLSRLLSLAHLDGDPTARDEILAALEMAAAQPASNHCLCHGDLGNLELFLQAARVQEQPRWLGAARLRATEVAASIGRDGWLCGSALAVELPGLMIGLAGIGYGLLRAACPDRVPAVLALRPGGAG